MDEIRTDRLRLRRARTGDAAAMHAILSDTRAMRYWSTEPHRTLAQTERWLAEMIAAPAAISDDYVIEHADEVIGKAGLWRLPEMGFLLHPDHWGRGLAREAVGAVIDHAFARHPIAAVTADVDPRNAASLNLLARLGFVETGRAARTYEIAGEYCDSVYLALSRAAHTARRR